LGLERRIHPILQWQREHTVFHRRREFALLQWRRQFAFLWQRRIRLPVERRIVGPKQLGLGRWTILVVFRG
jgi:hypothetical protein